MSDKWDRRFLELARHVAGWSKDPSTQTGAVVVDDARRGVSLGYNGFPRGVDDSPERYQDRDTKLRMVVHCERNAILFAQRDLTGCTLYTWPFMSCAPCAGMVIQAGIKRVVAPRASDELAARWARDLEVAYWMFLEAGVVVSLVEPACLESRPK